MRNLQTFLCVVFQYAQNIDDGIFYNRDLPLMHSLPVVALDGHFCITCDIKVSGHT